MRLNEIVKITIEDAIWQYLRSVNPKRTLADINEEIREHSTAPIMNAMRNMRLRLQPWLAKILADSQGFEIDPAAPETKGFVESAERYLEEH